MDPGADRGRVDAEELGDVFGGEVLVVAEHEDDALVPGKRGQQIPRLIDVW